jgi:hypothetical protein
MDHGAVLRDDTVDKLQVSSNSPQFIEDPPRDEKHDNAARASRSDGVPC